MKSVKNADWRRASKHKKDQEGNQEGQKYQKNVPSLNRTGASTDYPLHNVTS